MARSSLLVSLNTPHLTTAHGRACDSCLMLLYAIKNSICRSQYRVTDSCLKYTNKEDILQPSIPVIIGKYRTPCIRPEPCYVYKEQRDWGDHPDLPAPRPVAPAQSRKPGLNPKSTAAVYTAFGNDNDGGRMAAARQRGAVPSPGGARDTGNPNKRP